MSSNDASSLTKPAGAPGTAVALFQSEAFASDKEQNMKLRIFSGVAIAFALAGWACSGGSNYSTSPSPTPTPGGGGGGSASTTISIVGNLGGGSFTPNPGDAANGTTIAWMNNDSLTHRIVMNDGSLDTGNLAPGQTSAALTMKSNGGNYHCTIHPSMVGSIKSSTGQPPPCQGLYC
ncbi:MAG TPA: hypothetical protein VGK32_22970 [Vicinamibacterales bacterium]|jgi:plastocyanin